jgi:hypothetical protein
MPQWRYASDPTHSCVRTNRPLAVVIELGRFTALLQAHEAN